MRELDRIRNAVHRHPDWHPEWHPGTIQQRDKPALIRPSLQRSGGSKKPGQRSKTFSPTESGEIESREAALQFGGLVIRVDMLPSKQSFFEPSELHFDRF